MEKRVESMGRSDLHELLHAKLKIEQLKNHPALIAYFDELNLTCTHHWKGIPDFNIDAFGSLITFTENATKEKKNSAWKKATNIQGDIAAAA
ncbi:hypothetical protein R1flu_024829 [Riccia fluitans]|uniref:Uncharacterized protein n=1 Tax=Riccia fluitans TaxID=41844 RepID=A0ABD1XW59_9MARC